MFFIRLYLVVVFAVSLAIGGVSGFAIWLFSTPEDPGQASEDIPGVILFLGLIFILATFFAK